MCLVGRLVLQVERAVDDSSGHGGGDVAKMFHSLIHYISSNQKHIFGLDWVDWKIQIVISGVARAESLAELRGKAKAYVRVARRRRDLLRRSFNSDGHQAQRLAVYILLISQLAVECSIHTCLRDER